MDMFSARNVSPMLLTETKLPFDDANYIFELKLDGIRAIMYLSPDSVAVTNKRLQDVTKRYPELDKVKSAVGARVVLDGELVAIKGGKPDFFALRKRSAMTNALKTEIAAARSPVEFAAYDILYLDGEDLTGLAIERRKELLHACVRETAGLSVVGHVRESGVRLFELVKKEGLEGIVAKRLGSVYRPGRRSRDWIKIKAMQEEDLDIVGFVEDPSGEVKDLIYGTFSDGAATPQGKVYLGVGASDREAVKKHLKRYGQAPAPSVKRYPDAVWLKKGLSGTVRFMHKTESGALRQPVFKSMSNGE